MENRSDSIKELLTALSKAQSEMCTATKDSENPFFHSTYANLASVWEVARGPLTKYGLSIIQIPDVSDNGFILKTVLGHNSGEFIVSRYPITPMKQTRDTGWALSSDPQSIGSAISYAKRYALAAMLGIATADEDDDGEKAMGRGEKTKVQPAASKITKPAPRDRTETQKSPPEASKYIATEMGPALVGRTERIEKQTTDAATIDMVKDSTGVYVAPTVVTTREPPMITTAEIIEIFPGSEIKPPEALGDKVSDADTIYARLYSELSAVAGTKSKLKARLWWSQNVTEITKVSTEQKQVLRDFVNSVGKK